MEVHQLVYFITVAKYEHITRAAAELHISQSTLSAALKKLESELELKLYERTAKGVVLTSEGRIFLHRAVRIISEIESTGQMMAQLAKQNGGLRLHIACGETLGLSEIVYEAERQMAADEPGICFTNLFEEYGNNGAMLLSGDADMLFTYSKIYRPEIEWHKLCDDEMLLLVRKDDEHEMRKKVSMSELADIKLIAPVEHSFLRDHLDVMFGGVNMFTPTNISSCFSEADIPFLVESGMGCAIVTGLWWRQYCRRGVGKLHAVEIADGTAKLELGVARLTDMPHSERCGSIIEKIKNIIAGLYA